MYFLTLKFCPSSQKPSFCTHNKIQLMVKVTERGPQGHCTAWAIKPSIFATNAHCLEDFKDIQSQNIFIILNRNPSKKYRVISAKMHPSYKKTQKNFDGKESWGLSFDIGLATIEGRVDVVMPIAPRGELQKIGSGYPVAFLGFPYRNGLNYNVRDPIATMQSGIITGITDYWQGDSGYSKNFLLKHNMGSTGGASGSPIFNRKGQVIGIHNAGGRDVVVVGRDRETLQQIRGTKPSASMINYGVRIDTINALFR